MTSGRRLRVPGGGRNLGRAVGVFCMEEAVMSFRTLDETKISATTELLRQRIAARFPDSGLADVAGEVVQVARDAFARAERIHRPMWWLRVGLLAGAGLLLAAALFVAWRLAREENLLRDVDTVMRTAQGSLVYIVAVLLFLV